MEQSEIRQLLQAVAAGERSVDDALLQLKEAPFEDLGFAKLDHHRALRQGAAEVIYGAGKTMDETFGLIETVEKAAQIYMLTAHLPRVNTIRDDQMKELAEYFGVSYRKDFLNL